MSTWKGSSVWPLTQTNIASEDHCSTLLLTLELSRKLPLCQTCIFMNHELAVHYICKRHTRSRLESKTVEREEDVTERILPGKNPAFRILAYSALLHKWVTFFEIKTLASSSFWLHAWLELVASFVYIFRF